MINFKGVLFDLDGTLVDSTPAVERSWSLWCQRNNLDFEELKTVFHGKPAADTIKAFLVGSTNEQVKHEIEWLRTRESNDVEGVISLPGAIDFIDVLNSKNIPWAIVTSGVIPVAQARIKAAGIPNPEVLVTPECVLKGKPAPDPFLLGAELLGLSATDCVVFEDSPAGLIAGKAAGCKTVGITTTFSENELVDADACIDSMETLIVGFNRQHELII